MRAISLHQPYASAIAFGLKHIETRHWPARYTGRIVIHAAKRWTGEEGEWWESVLRGAAMNIEVDAETVRTFVANGIVHPKLQLPFGALICTAELYNCIPTESAVPGPMEYSFGNFGRGRYAWMLRDVKMLDAPVPYTGRRGWFTVPDELLAA